MVFLLFSVVLKRWRGHIDNTTCMTIVEDPKILITSSLDCTVRLWTFDGDYVGKNNSPDDSSCALRLKTYWRLSVLWSGVIETYSGYSSIDPIIQLCYLLSTLNSFIYSSLDTVFSISDPVCFLKYEMCYFVLL